MIVKEQVEFISPYELTGTVCGKELGGFIYKKAINSNIALEQQQVETKNYKGKVNVYPKHWLSENFLKFKYEFQNIKISHSSDDDLPF